MRKIYVYAGYYELFVTPKPLSMPFLFQGEFETVDEAEEFLDENFDTENDTVNYERSIFDDSRISFLLDEDAEMYKFDVTKDGNILQCTEDWKQKYKC